MNIELIREYCMAMSDVTEDMPFGEDVVTFRRHGKIFCCINLKETKLVTLKCKPEYSEELRASYSSIEPAWHWNKKHWIQINIAGNEISDDLVLHLIDHAYSTIR